MRPMSQISSLHKVPHTTNYLLTYCLELSDDLMNTINNVSTYTATIL